MMPFCNATRRDGKLIVCISERGLLDHLARDPMSPRITNPETFLDSLPQILLSARTGGDVDYYRSALEHLLARAAAEAAFERQGACWSRE